MRFIDKLLLLQISPIKIIKQFEDNLSKLNILPYDSFKKCFSLANQYSIMKLLICTQNSENISKFYYF